MYVHHTVAEAWLPRPTGRLRRRCRCLPLLIVVAGDLSYMRNPLVLGVLRLRRHCCRRQRHQLLLLACHMQDARNVDLVVRLTARAQQMHQNPCAFVFSQQTLPEQVDRRNADVLHQREVFW